MKVKARRLKNYRVESRMGINRRNFLKGTTLGVAAAATGVTIPIVADELKPVQRTEYSFNTVVDPITFNPLMSVSVRDDNGTRRFGKIEDPDVVARYYGKYNYGEWYTAKAAKDILAFVVLT